MGKEIIFQISHEELREWAGSMWLKRRKEVGATMNYTQQLKDLYYGVEEYTIFGGFQFKCQDKQFEINADTCLYEDEKFWYYMCFLGFNAPRIKNDITNKISEAQEYVKTHAGEYDMQAEITKLFLLGKSPYGLPSKEQIEYDINMDAVNQQIAKMGEKEK